LFREGGNPDGEMKVYDDQKDKAKEKYRGRIVGAPDGSGDFFKKVAPEGKKKNKNRSHHPSEGIFLVQMPAANKFEHVGEKNYAKADCNDS
jgi:hypothetical protein